MGAERFHRLLLGCLGIAHVLGSLQKQLLIPHNAGSKKENKKLLSSYLLQVWHVCTLVMEKATGATHPNPSSQAGLDDRCIEGGGDMATGSHGRAILGYTVT